MISVNELQLLSSSLPQLPGNDRVLTGAVGNSFLSGHHLAFSPRLDLAEFMLEEPSAMPDISDGVLLDAHLPGTGKVSLPGYKEITSYGYEH